MASGEHEYCTISSSTVGIRHTLGTLAVTVSYPWYQPACDTPSTPRPVTNRMPEVSGLSFRLLLEVVIPWARTLGLESIRKRCEEG